MEEKHCNCHEECTCGEECNCTEDVKCTENCHCGEHKEHECCSDHDKKHDKKKYRPIASGNISIKEAILLILFPNNNILINILNTNKIIKQAIEASEALIACFLFFEKMVSVLPENRGC